MDVQDSASPGALRTSEAPLNGGPAPIEATARLSRLVEKLDHYAARFERLRDSRSVFTHLYARMTERLAQDLPTRTWQDAGWVVALAESFSRLYIEALDAFDRGEAPSAAWQDLQTIMRKERTSVLQDLLGGMIGHIVHDLPLGLKEVGLDRQPSQSAVADYHQMNDVLGGAIAGLKAAIERRYNPFLGWLDWVAGDADEIATNYGIRLSRAAAWYNAERLGSAAAAPDAHDALETSPLALVNAIFRPKFLPARLLVDFTSVAISLGRRWPRPPVPALPAPTALPNQRYYFGTGAGTWRGTFRFRITDWAAFARARLGFWNRTLALGMAGAMTLFRRARIDSSVDAYPDQGPAGVAGNDIRISLLGLTLYLLREQYALGADGATVHVRSYERFGPVPFLFNVEKAHPAKVTQNGAHATYDIPLLGAAWIGEYAVTSRDHIESVLTCPWAEATESINRL